MSAKSSNGVGFPGGRESAWDLPCPARRHRGRADGRDRTPSGWAPPRRSRSSPPALTASPCELGCVLDESVLEDVYPSRVPADPAPVPVLEAPAFSRAAPRTGTAKPKVLIPVFPGTNCEYDSARAALRAGLEPQILVLNNQTPGP